MIFRLSNKISIIDLVRIKSLNINYCGNKKKIINNICSINRSNLNSLCFDEKDNAITKNKIQGIVITNKKNSNYKNQIIAKYPRKLFVKIVNILLSKELEKKNYPIKNCINFHLKKNKTNKISNNVFIGENVKLGKNCYLGKNVSIYPGTKIGNNVKIFDNTVLGIHGLGYIEGLLMPHIGNLIIKDNVTIGSNCTIVRGTLENTTIGKSVKISNNVNIGHNVKILDRVLIASLSSIAGGAMIESNCILSSNISIKNNIKIGKNSKIGIGSVVVKDVKKNSAIFGNPGKKIILLNKLI